MLLGYVIEGCSKRFGGAKFYWHLNHNYVAGTRARGYCHHDPPPVWNLRLELFPCPYS
jgi:hypothetical protein